MLYIIYKLKLYWIKIIKMLKNFLKPRKNASAIPLQKKNVAKRLAQKPPESDSDYSDSSSDSDYEEILISSMKRAKDKKEEPKHQPSIASQPPIASPVDDIPNHSNHFTEPKSDPIDIPKPKSKNKSRVVIKKYYNYKPKSERKKEDKKEPKPEPKPIDIPKSEPIDIPKPQPLIAPRTSYIGIGKRNNPTVNMSNRLSNRILNW